jgi:hypothetical protein
MLFLRTVQDLANSFNSAPTMKKSSSASHPHGSTILGLLVGSMVTTVLSAAVFGSLMYGMVLFSKTRMDASNAAHQQARLAALQIAQDIHSAISTPELVGTARQPATESGPAAGIAFHVFSGGPFKVTSMEDASTFTADFGKCAPAVGQRMFVPAQGVEIEISAVSAGEGTRTVTLASPLPGHLAGREFQGFVTDRVAYVVQGGELRYYGQSTSSDYSVLANGIVAVRPFSLPQTTPGGRNSKFVAAVNLSTENSSVNDRGYKAANLLINSTVPSRMGSGIYN